MMFTAGGPGGHLAVCTSATSAAMAAGPSPFSLRATLAGCTFHVHHPRGEMMPESPRSKAGRYIFIVIGCAIVVGALYYVLKGALHGSGTTLTTMTTTE
jgi:hypothetical protein